MYLCWLQIVSTQIKPIIKIKFFAQKTAAYNSWNEMKMLTFNIFVNMRRVNDTRNHNLTKH